MIEFNLLVFLLFAVVLEIAFAIFRPLSFIIMAGPAGLEPAAPGFGDQCSTKLSHGPALKTLRILQQL